jgi:ABC-type transport system involved in cytochrome c biogenesis permease component
MDLLIYLKKDNMDYSMIIFFGMVVVIFVWTIIDEKINEKK